MGLETCKSKWLFFEKGLAIAYLGCSTYPGTYLELLHRTCHVQSPRMQTSTRMPVADKYTNKVKKKYGTVPQVHC